MMPGPIARGIEREAADALLDAGVSVPLFSLRVPLTRWRWRVGVTMRRPTLGGLIRLSRLYCSLGMTAAEMAGLDKEGEMRFVARHGVTLSRMVAVTMTRGRWRRRWLERPLAWLVRHRLTAAQMTGAVDRFVSLLGTDPFMPIIRSAERQNVMRPRLSQRRKRS